MPLAFNVAFSTSLIPTISKAKAENNINEINSKLKFSILMAILIGLPCTFGMILFSKPILELLFPNASSGSVLLQISSISICISLLSQTIIGALQGVGKNKISVIALLCGGITKLFANLILIPIEGIYEKGAVIGTITCDFIVFFIVYMALKKEIKLSFSISKMIIKPLIATILMGILAVILYNYFINIRIFSHNFSLILVIIFAILVYSILIISMKIFSAEEIKKIF